MSNVFVAAFVVFAGRMTSPHPPILKRCCDTSASPSTRSLAVKIPSLKNARCPSSNWKRARPFSWHVPSPRGSCGKAEQLGLLARGLDPNITHLSMKRSSTLVCTIWAETPVMPHTVFKLSG
jgi:hypothetical protein